MKKNTTELGKYIYEAREKAGISQRQLAKLSKMDCAEVSRIEAGKRQKPNVLFLKGIAETLNLSLVKLMELAGYNDIDINWGVQATEKRSTKDFQDELDSYVKFYFDVLEDIDERRKNALECKNICTDLIDRIENPDIYRKEITIDEIKDTLKEMTRIMRPNLEKFDKSKYPKYDPALYRKPTIQSNTKVNFSKGTFTNKED